MTAFWIALGALTLLSLGLALALWEARGWVKYYRESRAKELEQGIHWVGVAYRMQALAKARGRTIHTLSLALGRKHREAARMHEAVRKRNIYLIAQGDQLDTEEGQVSLLNTQLDAAFACLCTDCTINAAHAVQLSAPRVAPNLTDAAEYRKVRKVDSWGEFEAHLAVLLQAARRDEGWMIRSDIPWPSIAYLEEWLKIPFAATEPFPGGEARLLRAIAHSHEDDEDSEIEPTVNGGANGNLG